MWSLYETLHSSWTNLVSKRVAEASEIIPVFREFFSKTNNPNATATAKLEEILLSIFMIPLHTK